MKSVNSWSCLNGDVLNQVLEGATDFKLVMTNWYIEYIVLYPNGFGFSISKTHSGIDTWEIIMLRADVIDDVYMYRDSEISNYDGISGLFDEQIAEKAKLIREFI